LSSRDKEVIKQVEEMERLKALAARLVEQQNAKQQQIETIMAEHSAEVKTLQEQLQQAKCSKEVQTCSLLQTSTN
jgi:TPP-dependent pyruvate/acetoin dehydrogenase alpha subunit